MTPHLISASLLTTIFALLIPSGNAAPSEADLTSLLQRAVVHRPEVFQHAVAIINDLETAPSCHRLATKNLLESCNAVEVPGKADDNLTLDLVKSVFATRLAVCELTGAHASVPPQCLPMVPTVTESHGVKCFLRGTKCSTSRSYDFPTTTTQKQINQCLSSLESRPQWWTSYSNARQNAVVMCHAARGEAEREHIIHLHRSMADSSAGISEALSKSAQGSNELLAAQELFAKSVAKLQNDIVNDMKSSRSSLNIFIENIIKGIDNKFESAAARLVKSTSLASTSVDALGKQVKDSTHELKEFDRGLHDIATMLQDQFKSVVAQNKNLDLTHGQVESLQQILSVFREQEVESLNVAVVGLQLEVHALIQLIHQMHDKHTSLDQRIDGFDQTLAYLHMRAEMAGKSMEQHSRAQEQLFKNLTSHIHATNHLAAELGEKLAGMDLHGFQHIASLFESFRYLFLVAPYVFLALGLALIFAYGWFGVPSVYTLARLLAVVCMGEVLREQCNLKLAYTLAFDTVCAILIDQCKRSFWDARRSIRTDDINFDALQVEYDLRRT